MTIFSSTLFNPAEGTQGTGGNRTLKEWESPTYEAPTIASITEGITVTCSDYASILMHPKILNFRLDTVRVLFIVLSIQT
jgi:hypothetical protein